MRCDRFVGEQEAEAIDLLPTSYLPGLTAADFNRLLPTGMARRLRDGLREFGRVLPGFDGPQGQVVGVETRTSSPVRIVRDAETLAADGLPGLYPAGEGAGYAGGIVSAALDGVACARAIAALLQPHSAAASAAE
jgi:hypothetical protein